MNRRRKSSIIDLDVGDDDRFFDPSDRLSCAVPLDLTSPSEDDDGDFDDARMSFSSAVSSVPAFRNRASSLCTPPRPSISATDSFSDYGVWMVSPDSISERRKRLLLGMGLDENMDFSKLQSTKLGHQYRVSISPERSALDLIGGSGGNGGGGRRVSVSTSTGSPVLEEGKTEQSSVSLVFLRSRSEGDIASFSMENKRKEELIGNVSKQHLTRTATEIPVPRGNVVNPARAVVKDAKEAEQPVAHDRKISGATENSDVPAFFLIKNLDTGSEFVVNECGENGAWNKLSDLQTGKKLTLEEFEKTVGQSRMVNKLMRRAKLGNNEGALDSSPSISRSLRMSISMSMSKSKSRRGSFLRNIKGVASGIIRERERDCPAHLHQDLVWEEKPKMSRWVRVRQSGKSYKEFSALHLCQEFQAHEGLIWKIKFNCDGRLLASAGEDKVVHVWEVVERDCMGFSNSTAASEEGSVMIATRPLSSEKKKGLFFGSKREKIPDYVHMSETVFTLSEEAYCTFHGHVDEVLDLAWSKSELLLSSSMDKTVRLWDLETKSCLKVFAHNDYVTCIEFNPLDEDYFISGCLDGKVRIWEIPEGHVIDWSDIHEMVTAIAYTPDGQGVLVGTMKGSCRTYSVEDCKLSQTGEVEIRHKKKSHLRKVTGFQFSPGNPSQVLVTSADARARIVEGSEVVHKFKGFKNADSQIAASFSPNGKFIISASDDSQVFIWKNNEEQKNGGTGKSRSIVVTRAHENFQCKDVTIAVTWPCIIRGDPPAVPLQSSKRISKPFSASSSGNVVDDTANKRNLLPPLPKKKNNQATDSASNSSFEDHPTLSHSDSRRMFQNLSKKTNGHTTLEEDDNNNNNNNPESISRSNSGISDSFSSSSSSSSTRYGFSLSAFGSSSFREQGHDSNVIYPSAWGLVIVTGGIGGEIRCYQNFGLPRKMSRI
ncbi:hypothetical protein PIB30_062222 [Stylosanthes scabra]|uniref:Uncharacterized protein n=1 Tax=Stylosanthes scabra TaxID=79078 RepID=A0ABU6RL74_9FABA|nr:hypothetical protein [Stylosanthes scabra]